jgi:hypothetical protein
MYGETQPILVNGMRGGNVYVLPSAAAASDRLLRDTIIYMTSVHCSGLALGLKNSRSFSDMMYS